MDLYRTKVKTEVKVPYFKYSTSVATTKIYGTQRSQNPSPDIWSVIGSVTLTCRFCLVV